MTNYKEIFQLAQDKGYKPFWFSNANFQDDMPLLPYCVSELTLIQKWLRDEHKIQVSVWPFALNVWVFAIELIYVYTETQAGSILAELLEEENKNMKHIPIEGIVQKKIPTYEEALLNGINEALKLI